MRIDDFVAGSDELSVTIAAFTSFASCMIAY